MRIKISTASLLATVAVLQTFAGGLWWFFYGNSADFAWNEWFSTLCAPAYVVLAFLGRRFPYPCAVVGLMLYLPVLLIDRHPESLADGGPLRIVNFFLLFWAYFVQHSRSLEARVGLPPLPRKTMVKVIVLTAGIVVSFMALALVFLVLAFNTTLKVEPCFKIDPWFDRYVYNVRREALICAIISAVASAVLTFCLLHTQSLMKERWREIRELKAKMKAEGKKWPWW